MAKNGDRIYMEPGSAPEMIHKRPVLPPKKLWNLEHIFVQDVNEIVKKYERNLKEDNSRKDDIYYSLREVWDDSNKDKIFVKIDHLVNSMGKNNNTCKIHIIKSYSNKIVFTVFRPKSSIITQTYIDFNNKNYMCSDNNIYLEGIEKIVKNGDRIYVEPGSTPKMEYERPVLPPKKLWNLGFVFVQDVNEIVGKHEKQLLVNNNRKNEINYLQKDWNVRDKDKIFKSIDVAIKTMSKKNKDCKVTIDRPNKFNTVFNIFKPSSVGWTPIYVTLESIIYSCVHSLYLYDGITKIAKNGDKIIIEPGSASKVPSEKKFKNTIEFDKAIDMIATKI
ncbi:MAG: hypothetical protein EOP34_10680 [Rickettsiales bacterium]|nr:MAG: hypothetical protein EOP34_10680 [Rickettsiales bacterium]